MKQSTEIKTSDTENPTASDNSINRLSGNDNSQNTGHRSTRTRTRAVKKPEEEPSEVASGTRTRTRVKKTDPEVTSVK